MFDFLSANPFPPGLQPKAGREEISLKTKAQSSATLSGIENIGQQILSKETTLKSFIKIKAYTFEIIRKAKNMQATQKNQLKNIIPHKCSHS